MSLSSNQLQLVAVRRGLSCDPAPTLNLLKTLRQYAEEIAARQKTAEVDACAGRFPIGSDRRHCPPPASLLWKHGLHASNQQTWTSQKMCPMCSMHQHQHQPRRGGGGDYATTAAVDTASAP